MIIGDEKGEPKKSVRLDESCEARPYDKAYDTVDSRIEYCYCFKTKKESIWLLI